MSYAETSGTQQGEVILAKTIKPVFDSKSPSNWMIQTSEGHLVFNSAVAAQDIAKDKNAQFNPLSEEALAKTIGLEPHGVNFLLPSECADNPHTIIRIIFDKIFALAIPGMVEYLGEDPKKSLENALFEVPLGVLGQEWSVIIDGTTLTWIINEMQKQYPDPEISILHHSAIDSRMTQELLGSIDSLIHEALQTYRLNEKAPLTSGFQKIQAHIEKYIREKAPAISQDLIHSFVQNFIQNFFATEARYLYETIDIFTKDNDSLDKEAIIAAVQQKASAESKFSCTEFYSHLIPNITSEDLCKKIAADLAQLGIITPQVLLFLLEDPKNDKLLTKSFPSLPQKRKDHGDNINALLESMKEEVTKRENPSYPRMDFTDEKSQSSVYFRVMQDIAKKFPIFLKRAGRKPGHALEVLDTIEQSMMDYFSQEEVCSVPAGAETIKNAIQSFCAIAFGQARILAHIIHTKLAVYMTESGSKQKLKAFPSPTAPKYQTLEEERINYTTFLAQNIQTSPKDQPSFSPNLNIQQLLDSVGIGKATFKNLIPELAHFLAAPFMREIFGDNLEDIFAWFVYIEEEE